MKKWLPVLAFLCSCALFPDFESLLKGKLSLYKKRANELTTKIKSKKSFEDIRLLGNELVELGSIVVMGYKEKEKSCDVYLENVLEAQSKMVTLQLYEIENQYHDGEALPETERESCVMAKELVVHPATVVILSRLEDNSLNRKRMVEELEKVIHQLDGLN
jgi:hypothetical protein